MVDVKQQQQQQQQQRQQKNKKMQEEEEEEEEKEEEYKKNKKTREVDGERGGREEVCVYARNDCTSGTPTRARDAFTNSFFSPSRIITANGSH